ncbi:MAG: protein-glutamate O-methyltransferase CheR [Candidatus Izemoplasmatales bacterium]
MISLQIESILKEKYLFDISLFSPSFIDKVIVSRMKHFGYAHVNEYETELLYNQEEVKDFIDALQIPFTFFFRNPLSFEILSSQIIPSLFSKVKNGKEIRVWSVGCSTGQEAYSLAILFEEAARRFNKPIPYRIFASDISEESIEKAKSGLYNESEIGNLRYDYIKRYFMIEMSEYSVKPFLREKIYFGFYNLLNENKMGPDDSIFASFDIVMCSNLLYYYNESIQEKMISKLLYTLNPGGYFLTSDTEKYLIKDSIDIVSVSVQSAVFHKVKRGDYL